MDRNGDKTDTPKKIRKNLTQTSVTDYNEGLCEFALFKHTSNIRLCSLSHITGEKELQNDLYKSSDRSNFGTYND